MNTNYCKCLNGFKIGFSLACGFFIVVFIVVLIMLICCDFSLFRDYLIVDTALDSVDLESLQVLVNKGKIISAQDMVGHIKSFYEALIGVMGAMVGLGAILGYMHIKVLTQGELEKYKIEAKDSAANEVKAYLKSQEFKQIVENQVGEALDGTEVDAINTRIAGIENDVESIKASDIALKINTIPDLSMKKELLHGDN